MSIATDRKGVKKAAAANDDEDPVSEKENNSSPVEKVRKAVIKAPGVETDSEPSPLPAKKAKMNKAKKPTYQG